MKLKLKSFVKNVAASGTPEALSATDIITSSAKIKARTTNTNPVFVGDSTGQEYPLSAGQELNLADMASKSGVDEVNLREVYIRVTTNGEGVACIYGQKPV